jgi:hypothetical protein
MVASVVVSAVIVVSAEMWRAEAKSAEACGRGGGGNLFSPPHPSSAPPRSAAAAFRVLFAGGEHSAD